MTTTHTDYLSRLAEKRERVDCSDAYLWPRTPIANIQAEIWARCGSTDYTKMGRVEPVLNTLQSMIINKLIKEDFSYLDICTGDALIPWQVQRQFPFSHCYGLDICYHESQALARRQGVRLCRASIQDLLLDHDVDQFDVVSMFNTYRGWQNADLRDTEKWIPGAVDEWFKWHAKYAIVTTHERRDQIAAGFWVKRIGQGEDGSSMVIMWPAGADQWNQ